MIRASARYVALVQIGPFKAPHCKWKASDMCDVRDCLWAGKSIVCRMTIRASARAQCKQRYFDNGE
jgi:hypothetical protein